jgi:arginyl-tRNA--protein-N-Asp/Glu arginylyltransferase
MYGKDKNYKYLYLGYYIEEVSSMAYKIRFKPGQMLEGDNWKNL